MNIPRASIHHALAMLLAGFGASSLAGAAAPTLPGPAFPSFSTPAELKSACDRGLAAAAQTLRQLERRAPDAGWLLAYDRLGALMEDAGYPLQFLSAVHPDKAVREASEACEQRWTEFNSALGQNEKLYQAAKRVKPRDAIDREFLHTLLEGFEDSGVGLPAAKRQQAKALIDRVSALGIEFDRNVRDAAVTQAYTEAELKGVPEAVWKGAKRDDQGRVLLGVDYPTYDPVMQLAEDGAARERMWRAKTNEGGEANLKLLAEITKLRQEYVSLFGASSWAEFTLRRRMAESVPRAQAFLAEVKAALEERERRELDELRRAKADHLGKPLDTVRMERWDLLFYTERVRKARYSVDQESFRQYFPPQESLQFCLRLIEKLMGVRYERVAGSKAWHPEVQAYRVSDAATGKPLGALWIDLYPREGKYNHAAVWGIRGSSTALNRTSQAALVVNFDRKGLTLDELETLLHELGHAVHNNLSATRYASQAGTSVKRDFVEAPSQMLEDWVYDKQVLKLFGEVCPACKPVPGALIDQARAARDYGKGVFQSRQHLYATYDLSLYSGGARDPMALWSQMEGSTPLGHVQGTMFPAGFSHIATNYSAGYYGYLWSLVVAMDMRTAFDGGKRLDPAVGRRYRDIVLANGSQRPPAAIVREFLGRDFNSKAFFEDLKK
jgi:thimet oligopeptidase